MKKHSSITRQDSVWRTLLNKYQADPGGFRIYLPEVAQELERASRSWSEGSHSTLTELERERLNRAVLQLLNKKDLSATEAIQALEYCATLVQDESLSFEVDRRVVVGLIQKATGISLSKIRKATKMPVSEADSTKEVALLRGVYLHLTWNDRLAAISISPAKAKERAKALKFVGIAKDGVPDAAQHHDAYLAEGVLDATS